MVARGGGEGEFLDARPGEVDVEEEEEDAEADDRSLCVRVLISTFLQPSLKSCYSKYTYVEFIIISSQAIE